MKSWCWHKWSKWIDVKSGYVRNNPAYGGEISWQLIVQERRCEKCNKVKLRIARWNL